MTVRVGDSCTGCGLCVATCTWRVLALTKGGVPGHTATGAERCNLCGHCEAVCPSGAIAVTDAGLAASSRQHGRGEIEPQQLGSYLRMRRSVRRYRGEPVDRGALEEMLDVVRFAPSGRNRQDVRWLIIWETKEVRRLTAIAMEWLRKTGAAGTPFAARFDVPGMMRAWENGQDPLCLHAPHLVIACAGRDNPVARTNAIIALAHLDIVAPSFGLGCCWGGIFLLAVESCKDLKEALQLPPDHAPVHCLLLGRPAIEYRRPPKRRTPSVTWR